MQLEFTENNFHSVIELSFINEATDVLQDPASVEADHILRGFRFHLLSQAVQLARELLYS